MVIKGGVDAFKRAKRRTTEKVLQKLGQSEQTQDEDDYNELHDEFAETNKEVVRLLSKLQLYVDTMEKWQKCGDALARELLSFAERGSDSGPSRDALEDLAGAFANTQDQMAVLCNNLIDAWSSHILSPLRDFTFRFNAGVGKQIAQRENDKVDYDVYRRRAKTIIPTDAKNTTKLNLAQRNFTKLAQTQDRFESNTNFLLGEFRRLRNERSDLVVDEVGLLVNLQSEFFRSLHQTFVANFEGRIESFLPDLAEAVDGKRRNRWLANGDDTTQALAGYCDDPQAPVASRPFSDSQSDMRPRMDRSLSARHYVRNAPRNNRNLSLKTIGRQLSLSSEKRHSARSSRGHNKTSSPFGDFVLPATQPESFAESDSRCSSGQFSQTCSRCEDDDDAVSADHRTEESFNHSTGGSGRNDRLSPPTVDEEGEEKAEEHGYQELAAKPGPVPSRPGRLAQYADLTSSERTIVEDEEEDRELLCDDALAKGAPSPPQPSSLPPTQVPQALTPPPPPPRPASFPLKEVDRSTRTAQASMPSTCDERAHLAAA